ncbi:MAG TPA: hypothetical protein PLX35_14820 [Cyclobacteriaceae bacterium]|nr:hypothetical protein [Cyclobacteriaceae bacterium]
MKQQIFFLAIICTLGGCDKTPDTAGYYRAVTFVNVHAASFLKSELLKYDYGLRQQYIRSTGDTAVYRALFRADDNRLLVLFGKPGWQAFAAQFRIPLDTNAGWTRLVLHLDSTNFRFDLEIHTYPDSVINADTIKVSLYTSGDYSVPVNLMEDPIAYLSRLDEERRKYGVGTYNKLRTGGIMELNFSPTDYLLYFPTDFRIGEQQFQDSWNKKLKSGKKLHDNWYYYKRDKPLD